MYKLRNASVQGTLTRSQYDISVKKLIVFEQLSPPHRSFLANIFNNIFTTFSVPTDQAPLAEISCCFSFMCSGLVIHPSDRDITLDYKNNQSFTKFISYLLKYAHQYFGSYR